MFIISQLIIPIFIGIIFYLFFKKFFSIKEILIFNGSVILLIFGCYFIGVYSRSVDTEYWTENIVRVEYYEPYETYIYETCTRSYACGTDSNGNTEYCTETYDCSYCNDVSTSYCVVTSLGNSYSIDASTYNRLVKKFNTKPYFVELNRSITHYFGCGKDGDAYFCDWDNSWVTAESYSTEHYYKNKVQFSSSLFNYKELTDTELTMIYDYPKIDHNGYETHIIGDWYKNNDKILASQYLNYWNGIYGHNKEVKMFIFIYKNKPESIGELQKQFFKNGNKNEYILVLDYDSTKKEIQWFNVITWSEVANIKTEVSAFLYQNRTASLYDIVKKSTSVLEKYWKRKNFKDFDYLMIEPSKSAWNITLTLNLILCIILGYIFYIEEI